MAANRDPGGVRRRSDKLRFISWANLLICVAAGLFLEIGDPVSRWSAVVAWALLFLVVCHLRARQMDKAGPVQRR